MEVLSVKDLKFSYYLNETDTFHALQNITFSVEQGEIVLFCGLCGCGKTTLLKLLKEEIRPDGKMEGEIENRYGSMQTGYLFQNPEQQIVCRTVEEELVFGAENMDMPRDEMARSAAELAAYLGIEKMLHESTQSLSGGQKQILNLASLLIMKPRILLLDEPVSQLDPVCTWEFMNLLKKVREDFGLTILVAEHNLDLFLPEADKVIYMENGRINYQGKKDLFIRKMFQEEKKFVESLPETVKLYHEAGGTEEWPFTAATLIKALNQEQRKVLFPEDLELEDSRGGQEVILIRGGYFRYEKNSRDILRDLDLSLYSGRIYGLIGGNGAGKSTLLSVLLGYRRFYRGKYQANPGMALLPQNPAYAFLKDTLMDDCRMIASVERIEELLNEDAFFSDVRQWLSKNPLDLSGGQMQKAAVFKILLKDPDILLLDEPVKALDGYEKEVFLQLLKRMKEKGKMILVVSHDLEFLQRVADECLFLYDGKISAQEACGRMFVNNRFYTTVKGKIKGMLQDESFITN